MHKLKMLQPRLKEVSLLPPGIKMVKYPHTPTKRVSKADNGRTLPLTSAAWRKLRRTVLAVEPLCRMCTARGLTVAATDVDHRDNDPSNNELVNLAPLCAGCHSRKTQRDQGFNARMGCATDGTPLDHSHHWNNAATGVLVSPAGQRSLATDERKPSSESSFIANSGSVA